MTSWRDSSKRWQTNPWVYLVVSASIGGSAVLPPLPSDSLLVTAMGLAAAGELTRGGVVLATLLGGLAGDLLAYTVGRILRRIPGAGGELHEMRSALLGQAPDRDLGPAGLRCAKCLDHIPSAERRALLRRAREMSR